MVVGRRDYFPIGLEGNFSWGELLNFGRVMVAKNGMMNQFFIKKMVGHHHDSTSLCRKWFNIAPEKNGGWKTIPFLLGWKVTFHGAMLLNFGRVMVGKNGMMNQIFI